MKKRISFTIEGEPTGKGRPRHGKYKTYTPAKTKAVENNIAYFYKVNIGHYFEGYVKLKLDLYYSIAKSDSKKKKLMKLNNELRPNKKPDIDNVVKLVADALNEVAYKDDTQIIELECRKFYSDIPRIKITIEDL
jgi:Holliday junction resolvase RusA-like endonuclease